VTSASYTCARCGGRFTKGRSDEEAAAESRAIWGPQDDLAVVCEDCWELIRPAICHDCRAVATSEAGTIYVRREVDGRWRNVALCDACWERTHPGREPFRVTL
jgi:DNA-directed RNA polymerase subunit RPC12/RpoP